MREALLLNSLSFVGLLLTALAVAGLLLDGQVLKSDLATDVWSIVIGVIFLAALVMASVSACRAGHRSFCRKEIKDIEVLCTRSELAKQQVENPGDILRLFFWQLESKGSVGRHERTRSDPHPRSHARRESQYERRSPSREKVTLEEAKRRL